MPLVQKVNFDNKIRRLRAPPSAWIPNNRPEAVSTMMALDQIWTALAKMKRTMVSPIFIDMSAAVPVTVIGGLLSSSASPMVGSVV